MITVLWMHEHLMCVLVFPEVKRVTPTKGQMEAAVAAQAVDISRLDLRVGNIVSAEKVGSYWKGD